MSRNRIIHGQSPSNNGRPCQVGVRDHRNSRRREDTDNPGSASTPSASGTTSANAEDDSAVITVTLDSIEHRLTVEVIQNDEFVEEVVTDSQSAETVAVDLDNLLEFGFTDRLALYELFVKLGVNVVYRLVEEEFDELFAAVLELLPDDSDMEMFATAKDAVLQVVALRYPGALEEACGRVIKKMKEQDITGVTIRGIIQNTRDILDEIEDSLRADDANVAQECSWQLVSELFPEAPVSEEAIFPPGWDVTPAGIFRRDSEEQVTPVPVCIVARGKNGETDEEILVVTWQRDGQWKQRVVERAVIANARNLVDVSAFGFPVTSNNAKHLVDYLADYETANLESLPMTHVSERLGFCKYGFLWGNTLVTKDGLHSAPEDDVSNRTGSLPIIFRGRDDGDDQLAEGFHSQGDFSSWKKAIAPLGDYPKAKLGFYVAFVPPMLHILKSSNFSLDFAGFTSTGKTTVLRGAASVWGNPDERKVNGREAAIATWESTTVWRERAPAVINNLPFILDDTRRAKKDEDVAATAYSIAQGRGKGRGTIKGTARSSTFQTVLISSGEQPMTSFTYDGGTRARVLTLWGSPFEATDMETAQLVQQIDRQIKEHYGHAGPLFVQFLLKRRSKWGMWRKEYRKWIDLYVRLSAGDPIAGRMAAYFAAISITTIIVHQALNLPWDYEDCIEPLWDELVGEVDDPASAALRHVMEWASAHQDEFWRPNQRAQEQRQPHQGWAGRWEPVVNSFGHADDDSPDYEWVGFIPARLKEVLRQGGFEPESTVRTWGDRDWLHCTEAARNQLQTRLAGKTTRMVAVTADAVQGVENG